MIKVYCIKQKHYMYFLSCAHLEHLRVKKIKEGNLCYRF